MTGGVISGPVDSTVNSIKMKFKQTKTVIRVNMDTCHILCSNHRANIFKKILKFVSKAKWFSNY